MPVPSIIRTTAFSVERARQQMFDRVAIPPELLSKVFKNLNEQLDAKETKFFSNNGIVTDDKEVVAYEVRQRAQDQILKIAGAYARERDERPGTPTMALEVDQAKGIIRLVIGGGENNVALEASPHNPDSSEAVNATLGALPQSLETALPNGPFSVEEADAAPQVIRTRGKTVEEIKREAFEVDG